MKYYKFILFNLKNNSLVSTFNKFISRMIITFSFFSYITIDIFPIIYFMLSKSNSQIDNIFKKAFFPILIKNAQTEMSFE